MRVSETHTVRFDFPADEQFLAPAAEYVSYRGRRGKDGLMIKVSYVTVDLNPGKTFLKVVAEGAAVLVNGSTSGYGLEAELTTEERQLFADEALKVIRHNKHAEAGENEEADQWPQVVVPS